MDPKIYADVVRLSALGQLLYKKPVERSPSELPSKLEEEVLRIDGVSAQPRLHPIEPTRYTPLRKVELHEYLGTIIDEYV